MAYVSNYLISKTGEHSWRWMLGVGGIPAVAYFFLLFFVPESPRFLIKKGKITEARNVLVKIETRDIETEITDIKLSLSQKKEKLFSGRYSKPIALAFLVAMFNQF